MFFSKNLLIFAIIIFLYTTQLTLGSIEDGEMFEFNKPEAFNALGIFPTVMGFIERPFKKTTEKWIINRAFTTEDSFSTMKQACDARDMGSSVWTDCQISDERIIATVKHGVPEPKNKTITYLTVDFKPFRRPGEDGVEEVCLLNEVYDTKVFFAVMTFSKVPSNKTFPKTPVESVATVHQHQLAAFPRTTFFEGFKGFEDGAIYDFGEKEYFGRKPPYECFLAIGTSQSVDVIEEKCSIFCLKQVSTDSKEFQEGLRLIKKRKIKLIKEKKEPELDDENIIQNHAHHEL